MANGIFDIEKESSIWALRQAWLRKGKMRAFRSYGRTGTESSLSAKVKVHSRSAAATLLMVIFFRQRFRESIIPFGPTDLESPCPLSASKHPIRVPEVQVRELQLQNARKGLRNGSRYRRYDRACFSERSRRNG